MKKQVSAIKDRIATMLLSAALLVFSRAEFYDVELLRARLDQHRWPTAFDVLKKNRGLKDGTNESSWLTGIYLGDSEMTKAYDLPRDSATSNLFPKAVLAHAPTTEANSWDCAFYHQLQLRSIQVLLAHNAINLYPMQSMSYFYAIRAEMTRRKLLGLPPPTVCEIGFGSGMSSAILLTATAEPTSTHRGAGAYHLFDCHGCAGGGSGKNIFLKYLKAVFTGRITLHDGDSMKTLPAFRKRHPDVKCDIFHIDGGHTIEPVTADLANAWALSHEQTLLLMDDTVPGQPPAKAANNMVKAGKMVITQQQQSSHVDPVMASYRGYRPLDKNDPTKGVQRKIQGSLKVWQVGRFLYPAANGGT